MKAVVYDEYGSPEILRCREIEKPTPDSYEALVKVRAASLNPLDCGALKGVPYLFRLVFGLQKPTPACPGQLGVDLAGQVEAVGGNVTQFQPGDEVFGVCVSDPQASGARVWVHKQGSLAEYVCAPQSTLVLKPDNLSFEQAATVPLAAFTALQGLRDKGQIQPGQSVLVNGAAGGVGTFAIQIAKSFGAEVTGVCTTRNVEMVKSIGADHVIDYTREDFTQLGRRFDLIFDCVGNHSLSEYRRVLNSKGICVMVGDLTGRGMIGILTRLASALTLSAFGSRKLITFLARPDKKDLTIMHDLLKTGKVVPVIDKCYALAEVPDALAYLASKHARGKIVITLEGH